ncbi:hypothetical protein [Enterovirga aerilata]|uniref:Uncharacterized protein n=1 Tax=Enterovirga aerilata TaxID=2730920 RepID=A0A849ICS8_9HYPH|nr:hypothetical protein [Enterovirga sp. DB1703]NNM75071.1 hypothetical protein [Enterovirga sp. DB1703]
MPIWPDTLTIIKATRPNRRNPARSGGADQTGSQQFVFAPGGGVWTWSLTVAVRTRDDVLDLGAFVEGMDGQAGTAMVPIYDGKRSPWNIDPLTGGAITPAKHAASIADDPAFATNPITTGLLDFRLGAPAGLNATRVTIARYRGGLIRPGMFFSVGSELKVITALNVPDSGASSSRIATIRPWLRAARSAGAALEFGRPVSLARFASDDTGRQDLDLLRFGQVTLDFVEAF